MNSKFYIGVIVFLVLCSSQAFAQFGHVVIHSDPRLAVLLKKNPVAAPPPTPVPNPEGKANAKTPTVKDAAGAAHNEEGSTEHHFVPLPTHRDGKVVYSGKGFRVQIYNGYDRDQAIKVRAEFMRNNPDTRTYLNYVSPFFRVKVGDYRTREQAAGLLREVKSNYSTPCMIVPDQITIRSN